MKKVTTIVLNGFTNDSRVLKENLSLKKAGYDVKILALHKKGLKEFEIVEEIPVYRLNASKRNLVEENTTTDIDEIVNEKNVTTDTDEIVNEKNVTTDIDEIVNGENITNAIEFIDEKTSSSKLNIIKKFIGLLRKYKRKIVALKTKFLNKYFKLHKFKFNMLFVQECKDSDIIHCNDLYTLPMGVIVKKFYNKNVKIVYDAHEYETEVNGLTGKKKLFRKFMEKSLIKYADKVICVSDAIANEYVRLYNIKKPALVLNTPPYQEIEKKNFFREELGIQENQTIFLYQGGLSKGRGIEILLETFKSLNNDKSVIVFMGYGPLEELVKEASNDYNNIYFYEAVSPNVLLGFTSSADFGILFYENNCLNHYYCSPNKMFEYLMAGIPVIASNLYEMKRLVENNSIGIVAEDNTPKGLIDAINKAILLDKKELDKNINKVKEVYNWEEQEKVLLSLYKELDE